MESALDPGVESRYWFEASTGCVIVDKADIECNVSMVEMDELLVDSGCDMTTLPESYRRYVVKGPLGPKVTIRLVGNKQVLSASEPYLVVLPVEGNDGKVMLIEETTAFSDCRIPLYAAMYRDKSLRRNEGNNGRRQEGNGEGGSNNGRRQEGNGEGD